MNKQQLVNTVAEATGLTKAQSKAALDATLSTITNELAAGNSVQLIGFGSLGISTRAARTGVNPSTGEAIEIPASKAVKFKAGKSLKTAVNS